MVKTTVYLDTATAVSLRQMAEVQGRPQAELIREALRSYTARAGRPRAPGIGKYKSGRRDNAARTDEILAEAAKQDKWR